MKKTIFTHFWNEELLLPYWLKHHREMFDHGVLIDYHSTDKSREIIAELAPEWEVFTTKHEHFHPITIDAEVMEYEEQYDGWKLALCITEFLFHQNLEEFLNDYQKEFPEMEGVRTRGFIIVDRKDQVGVPLTDEPLIYQRHNGYEEIDYNPHLGNTGLFLSRSRAFHKKSNGNYHPGRHGVEWQNEMIPVLDKYRPYMDSKGNTNYKLYNQETIAGIHPELILCWYGKYCPHKEMLNRYIEMLPKRLCLSVINQPGVWKPQYVTPPWNLIPHHRADYKKNQKKAFDLLEEKIFERIFTELY